MGVSPADAHKLVLDRYVESIQYYWSASRSNKRAYKLTRSLSVVLGAVVTLMSSALSTATLAKGSWAEFFFQVLTPLFATSLAIVGGFSQNFQWGAAWSDMVITAQRLETERDRISVSPPDQFDAVKEMALLDRIVLEETTGFFQRLFGSTPSGKPSALPPNTP